MKKVLEELLGKHQISGFSKEWIENKVTDDNVIRAVYATLEKLGLTDSKIATQAHLLGMNPDTIDRNYQRLSGLGLTDSKIATQAHLLGRDPDTIDRNYQRLSGLGLADSKIATQAHLLGRDPDTIDRNYQNHIRLLRNNNLDRNSGKNLLLQYANLLGTSPETIEANVQWLADRNLDYNNGILLGTKTQTKRKKLAWILREVFDYKSLDREEKKQAIQSVYSMVRDTPQLLIDSIKTLEKKKNKIIERADQHK